MARCEFAPRRPLPESDGKISRFSRRAPAARVPMTSDFATGTAARRDSAWLVLAMVAVAFVSIHFEVSEMLLSWTRPWERYQLDELPGILLCLAFAFAWFAWRRMRDARVALARRLALERDLAAALAENRRLAQSIVQLQEEERRGLAREMHDELGQHLNAIKIDAVTIRQNAKSEGTIYSSAESIIRVTDRVHAVVRDIMRKLRPAGLDELGLSAALENYIEEWRARYAGIAVSFTIDGELEQLGESLNMLVYRVVQESLTNVAKHAHARNVSLRIARAVSPADGDQVVIEISDDGGGRGPAKAGAGLGLIGMRERVDSAGGRLEIGNRSVHGFRVVARVPVSAR
jgi:two-component system sensor histidine kinase UhpB